jgi:spore maturation protein CgeB
MTSFSYVFLGLSITSSWGNGHATTYRGLLRELARRGHRVTFLERDLPYYAGSRDLPDPTYARTILYDSLEELKGSHETTLREADLVVVGSFVPEGIAVGQWATRIASGKTAFYDIDTPVTLKKLETGFGEYVSRELIPAYSMYLSFTGGPTLLRLKDEYGAKRVRPLYCSCDPELYFPDSGAEPRWDLGYLGTYSEDRQPALKDLLLDTASRLPSRRFVVGGPQYPADIVWPKNVDRMEHVAPGGHRSFYTSQRLTLSITRRDMREAGFSPSIRLFEAAACGTPIVTDPFPGLEQFFRPVAEIVVARTGADVLRCLQDMTPRARSVMAARARRKVLSEHTAAHRAEALEKYTEEVLTRRPSHTAVPVTIAEGAS